MHRRSRKGQSMVEYALGLGCVAAVCMVVLGALGHICGDMIFNVQQAVKNSPDTVQSEPQSPINTAATPWVFN
jgi:hypothetical protein